MRLGTYVDLDVADDVIGIQALRRIQTDGPRRQQLGLVLEGAEPPGPGFHWLEIRKDGRKIGDLTNYVWSWRLERIIGFALIARDCRAGETVGVITGGRRRTGTLTELPFL